MLPHQVCITSHVSHHPVFWISTLHSNRRSIEQCCVSCFVHVCCHLQWACSVAPTCIQASFVLLLMSMVLYAWCYFVLLHSM